MLDLSYCKPIKDEFGWGYWISEALLNEFARKLFDKSKHNAHIRKVYQRFFEVKIVEEVYQYGQSKKYKAIPRNIY